MLDVNYSLQGSQIHAGRRSTRLLRAGSDEPPVAVVAEEGGKACMADGEVGVDGSRGGRKVAAGVGWRGGLEVYRGVHCGGVFGGPRVVRLGGWCCLGNDGINRIARFTHAHFNTSSTF